MKNIYIVHRGDDYDTPYLEHYGVKGMEWGKQKFNSVDQTAKSSTSNFAGTVTSAGSAAKNEVRKQEAEKIKAQIKKTKLEITQLKQKYKTSSANLNNILATEARGTLNTAKSSKSRTQMGFDKNLNLENLKAQIDTKNDKLKKLEANLKKNYPDFQ